MLSKEIVHQFFPEFQPEYWSNRRHSLLGNGLLNKLPWQQIHNITETVGSGIFYEIRAEFTESSSKRERFSVCWCCLKSVQGNSISVTICGDGNKGSLILLTYNLCLVSKSSHYISEYLVRMRKELVCF
jgi:hypothetical protein